MLRKHLSLFQSKGSPPGKGFIRSSISPRFEKKRNENGSWERREKREGPKEVLLELVDSEVYPIVFGNPGSQRQKRVPSKDSRESFSLIQNAMPQGKKIARGLCFQSDSNSWSCFPHSHLESRRATSAYFFSIQIRLVFMPRQVPFSML